MEGASPAKSSHGWLHERIVSLNEKLASRSLEQGNARTGKRIDQIERSVNELYLKLSANALI
jgi:hypothetical protein